MGYDPVCGLVARLCSFFLTDMVFSGSFASIFKSVSGKFQECNLVCLNGASRKFEGPFKQVSRRFQEFIKDILRVFLGSFNGVSRVF